MNPRPRHRENHSRHKPRSILYSLLGMITLPAILFLIVYPIVLAFFEERENLSTNHHISSFSDNQDEVEKIYRQLKDQEGKSVEVTRTVVQKVIDGDSIILENGGKFRYQGIDTPEASSQYYLNALELNRQLTERKEVHVFCSRGKNTDRYGRKLGAIFILEPQMMLINSELIQKGMAHAYFKDNDAVTFTILPLLIKEQNLAMDRKAGIWSGPRAIRGDGRQVKTTRNRFHKSDCKHVKNYSGISMTREKALRAGKSPCRTCSP